MNAPVKNTAPVAEGEEEENPQDDLKQAGDQQKENEQVEIGTEAGMMNGLVSGGLAAFTLQFSEYQKIVHGFKGLNNSNFRHQLLKVRDRRGFFQAQQDLENARGEVEKQRKRAAKKKNGKDTAHIGLWGNRQEIKFADFDRREQAFQIGAAVQNHVTTEERFIRTKNAFGLDDAHTKQLRDGYATWRTQNKGKGIDEYIASTEARNIYREQYNKQGKKLDGKTEKKGISYAYDSDDKSRVEAIKNSKEVIKKGQTEIKDVLDSGNTYTQEHVDQKIQAVTQAQTAAPTPISTPAPTPATPAAPATPAPPPTPPSPAPVPIPLPVTPSTPPIKPTFFSKHFPRISKTFNIVNSTINTVKEKIAAGIISALGKTVLKGAMNSALGLMVKSGIGAALGVATGGLSVAVSVGWEVLKHLPVIGGLFNAIEGAAMGMVKGIAILVIAVPLIILIFSVFQASKLMDQFVSGNQKIVYSPEYEQAENWKNFENSFIALESSQKISWDQLEKNLFTLHDSYLSLDPDRHDQMEK